jgi:hypothetical protein
MKSLLVLSAFVLVTAAGVHDSFADVALKTEERQNLGIQTEAVQMLDAARQWPAAATVLDAASLVTMLSDLQAAESAAEASREEYRRSEQLYQNDANVARKARDAARTQAITDEGKVAGVRSQLLSAWGPSIVSMSPAARAQLVAELLNGRAALVRAEPMQWLPQDARVTRVELGSLNGPAHWSATVLGALPQNMTPAFAGALLLRVPASLTAGQALQARLLDAQPSVHGPSVPAAAIIRWHGSEWIYAERSANTFVRYAVRPGVRIAGRALVAGDVPPDAKVVVVGARALLGAELSAAEPDDESGA